MLSLAIKQVSLSSHLKIKCHTCIVFLVNPTMYQWSDIGNDYNDYNGVPITYLLKCTQKKLCAYDVVLGDRMIIPSPPDLNSSSYFESFIGTSSMNSYVDFFLTTTTTGVTAIELSFLNSPANRISLPDITILAGQSFETVMLIASWIFDNQDLAQTDNQVRTISIRPLSPLISAANLRIRFQFTEFHDFDWVFLSEVRFCTQLQPPVQLQAVILQTPSSIIVQPSADDLRRGSTELVCTVASEGSYTWQWERDSNTTKNNENYRITIGDGSRTTKLTINKLDFSDAANYECIATITQNVHLMNSTACFVEFPGT